MSSGRLDWSIVAYATAAAIVMIFAGPKISFYFLIWLFGAAINLAPDRHERTAKLWYVAAAGALLLVFAVVEFRLADPAYSRDFAVGIAATAFIFAVLRSNARSKSGIYSRAVRELAGFSYTLYLVHLPALIFVSAWLVPRQRWQPDAVHIAMVTALGICALGYAFAVAQLTEFRTGAVRSRVVAAISQHRSSPVKKADRGRA